MVETIQSGQTDPIQKLQTPAFPVAQFCITRSGIKQNLPQFLPVGAKQLGIGDLRHPELLRDPLLKARIKIDIFFPEMLEITLPVTITGPQNNVASADIGTADML